MALLSGAWTPNVIWYLSGGPRRFGELRADIPRISAKVLSARLRELEEKGVIDATVDCELAALSRVRADRAGRGTAARDRRDRQGGSQAEERRALARTPGGATVDVALRKDFVDALDLDATSRPSLPAPQTTMGAYRAENLRRADFRSYPQGHRCGAREGPASRSCPRCAGDSRQCSVGTFASTKIHRIS